MKLFAPIASSALLCCSLLQLDARAEQAPPREVALPELLSYAEQHAPRLELARRQRARADAARADASAWLHEDPTLMLAAGPRFGGADSSALDLAASVAQPIEVAGEPGLRRTLAARLSERVDAELAGARAALQLEVRLAYQDAAVAGARLELARRLDGFAERTREVARRRLTAGDVTRIDVLVAEAGAARAHADVIDAEHGLAEARTALAELIGWPLREPPSVPSGLEPPRPPPSLALVLERAEASHPELRARRAAAAEARARLDLAERQALPAPTVGLSLTREGSVGGSPANTILLGSLQLPLPLWAGNREARARDRAEATIASEEQRLAAQQLSAAVLRAHMALTSAAERASLLDGGVSAALDQSLGLLQRGFEQGELSALDVAAVQEKLASAQAEALTARADYHRARAQLEYLGGPVSDGVAAHADGAAP